MINETRQKRTLLIIIAILLLANVVTLVMFFKSKPHKGGKDRQHNMVSYLKKDVGFTDNQIAVYDSLHNKHMREVEEMFGGMRQEKESRFSVLARQEFSDSAIGLAADVIAEKQKALEIKMLLHLREIRSIATPAQKQKFDTSFLEFMVRKEKEKAKVKAKRSGR